MRNMRLIAAALVLGTAGVTATPATSQVQIPSGLVNVTVGDVILKDILRNNEVTALNNLNVLTFDNVLNQNVLQVQVPVGIAANVCNVSAAVLGAAGSGGGCTARSGSQALAQAIRKQHLRKK